MIEMKLYIRFLVAKSNTANTKAIDIIIPYVALGTRASSVGIGIQRLLA